MKSEPSAYTVLVTGYTKGTRAFHQREHTVHETTRAKALAAARLEARRTWAFFTKGAFLK